jgi:hypothetical protein
VSLADEREWRQRSAAGQLHEAMGMPLGARCPAADVEARVQEAKTFWAETYGRQLSEGEISHIRQTAELRYRPEPARQLPTSVPELVQAVNARVVGAGWRFVPEFAPGNSGVAMRGPDGTYTGDPRVAAKAQAADDAARGRLGHITNIATSHHVGPPT